MTVFGGCFQAMDVAKANVRTLLRYFGSELKNLTLPFIRDKVCTLLNMCT